MHDNKTNICDANNFEMEYKFVELIHKFMCCIYGVILHDTV